MAFANCLRRLSPVRFELIRFDFSIGPRSVLEERHEKSTGYWPMSLWRQDIQILVGYGCPTADEKVVMAAKLLRKHVHLDEGDVRAASFNCYSYWSWSMFSGRCIFLNYRRNTACFHCECKRPPEQFMEDKLQERHQNPRTRLERTASRPEVSNAWNFDFDDDESDGADVAAFEYADSSMKGEDSPLHSQEEGRNHRGVGNREYSDSDHGTGFDDFDDEKMTWTVRNGPSIDFSEYEGDSGSEDGNLANKSLAQEKARSLSPNRPLKPLRPGRSVPGSYDDEVDFDSVDKTSVRPNWRSSHVADSRNRGRGRSPPGKFRGLSYGSDEEAGLYLDSADDSDEDFRMRRGKAGKFSDKVGRQRNSHLSGFESDDYTSSHRTKFGRKGTEPNRRGGKFDGRGLRSNRNNFSDDDFDRPSRGAHGGIKSRGPRADEFRGRRNDQRLDGSRNYKSPRAGKFENNQRGRFAKYKDDGGGDSDDFRNRRRVIER
ncbi:hypothetical protein ACJRO7_011148 [Eucalyptus globulus]|uniref:Uncharacterized protein n=1 Tax=Eucalyptus globulus TaxID=34317 RepID=A0ABD3LP41_EUCGL